MTTNRRAPLLPIAASLVGAIAGYRYLLAPRVKRWGATDEEVLRTMAGDELVPMPIFQATHGITIDAPAEDVWPWLVQIGYGRAGFYSYELVERTMGLKAIRNADAILPQFQNPKLGDIVPFGPGKGPAQEAGLRIVALEPNRQLCLAIQDENGTVTWAFGLYPIDARTTRLVSRNQGYMPDWTLRSILAHPSRWQGELPMKVFLNLGALVMVSKMLRGVKQRAEQMRTEEVKQEAILALSSGCE